jgi:hypothetical protein
LPQQGEAGAQQLGSQAGAQQVGSAGAQQVGSQQLPHDLWHECSLACRLFSLQRRRSKQLGLQQLDSQQLVGAQQLGSQAGAQQLGSQAGAQQLGSQAGAQHEGSAQPQPLLNKPA